jgi:hypothetical protein
MKTLVIVLAQLRFWFAKLGPYVMLEMLLPGGTLVALLLFLYRRRKLALMAAA